MGQKHSKNIAYTRQQWPEGLKALESIDQICGLAQDFALRKLSLHAGRVLSKAAEVKALCNGWQALQREFNRLRGNQLLRLVTAVHSTLDFLDVLRQQVIEEVERGLLFRPQKKAADRLVQLLDDAHSAHSSLQAQFELALHSCAQLDGATSALPPLQPPGSMRNSMNGSAATATSALTLQPLPLPTAASRVGSSPRPSASGTPATATARISGAGARVSAAGQAPVRQRPSPSPARASKVRTAENDAAQLQGAPARTSSPELHDGTNSKPDAETARGRDTSPEWTNPLARSYLTHTPLPRSSHTGGNEALNVVQAAAAVASAAAAVATAAAASVHGSLPASGSNTPRSIGIYRKGWEKAVQHPQAGFSTPQRNSTPFSVQAQAGSAAKMPFSATTPVCHSSPRPPESAWPFSPMQPSQAEAVSQAGSPSSWSFGGRTALPDQYVLMYMPDGPRHDGPRSVLLPGATLQTVPPQYTPSSSRRSSRLHSNQPASFYSPQVKSQSPRYSPSAGASSAPPMGSPNALLSIPVGAPPLLPAAERLAAGASPCSVQETARAATEFTYCTSGSPGYIAGRGLSSTAWTDAYSADMLGPGRGMLPHSPAWSTSAAIAAVDDVNTVRSKIASLDAQLLLMANLSSTAPPSSTSYGPAAAAAAAASPAFVLSRPAGQPARLQRAAALTAAAQAGNLDALTQLGLLIRSGWWGDELSNNTIHSSLRTASAGGYSSGGNASNDGQGHLDDAVARGLLRQAADAGCGDALVALGDMCLAGEGLAPEPSAAVAYYTRAALTGHREGTASLAGMLERGQGVARDTRRAAQVYVRAAQLGCTQSAQRLEELLHSEAHPYGSALTHGCVQAVRASPKVTNSKASGAMAAEGASTGGRTQKDSPGGGMMPGGSGPSVRFALGETAERVLGGKAGALAHVH